MFRALGHDRYTAFCLAWVAATAVGVPEEYDWALGQCAEAAELAHEVGEPPLVAQVLNAEGELARVHDGDERAGWAYHAALAAARAGDERGLQSVCLSNLSYLASHRRAYDEAYRLAHEALGIAGQLGFRMVVAWCLSEVAMAEVGAGRPEPAARLGGTPDAVLELLGTECSPGDVHEHD